MESACSMVSASEAGGGGGGEDGDQTVLQGDGGSVNVGDGTSEAAEGDISSTCPETSIGTASATEEEE